MTLAHDVAGDGPLVVLVHSFVCDRRMWDPLVSALVDAGCRVLRCDLRGFGESPMPVAAYNDADDVVALVGDESFALVAASGGGQVGQEIAARWPERVTALVLLCSATRGHEPSKELRAFGRREKELMEAGDLDGMTELNVEMWLGPEADEQTRAAVRTMQRRAFEVQMAQDDEPEPTEYAYELEWITAPTLLITGGHDVHDFREIADEVAKTIPGATRKHLLWAGHLPSMERPDLTNPIILDFLATTRPAPTR
ncbi:alpha/beta fold hydrolase [Actinoplanes sp. CA-030573]|uniref:alpha/beta fold hydrolase n=1 Tax=Actinoplanes sp. CA-030573 TaxID=3239898 RepID=UPI003D8B6E95